MTDTWFSPEHAIYLHSNGEPLHTVEMHVLARAYRAAWRSQFASEPRGPHVIASLDVLFVFPPDGAGRASGAGPKRPMPVPLL